MTKLFNKENHWGFNPEIFATKATHRFKGNDVKVFPSTMSRCSKNGLTAKAEITTGPSAGKWTTVFLDRAEEI